MTTTVRVMIEGNKECEVKVTGPGTFAGQTPTLVKPGSFVTKSISGEQVLSVQEVGGFLS